MSKDYLSIVFFAMFFDKQVACRDGLKTFRNLCGENASSQQYKIVIFFIIESGSLCRTVNGFHKEQMLFIILGLGSFKYTTAIEFA